MSERVSSAHLPCTFVCERRGARKLLAENIVIVGGTSMLLGVKSRIFEELKALLKEFYAEKLADLQFKLHTPPTKANYTCWTGASLFGATDAIATR